MADDEKTNLTQDDLNLFFLSELERVNAVLDVLIEHSQVSAKAVALARLKVEMRQLERARSVALQSKDFEEMTALGTKHDALQRQITALETEPVV